VGRYVLVLSETVLVLVIESSLKRSNGLSAHDLPLTETQLVPFSEHENERKHEPDQLYNVGPMAHGVNSSSP
jgi:hypothetical protein